MRASRRSKDRSWLKIEESGVILWGTLSVVTCFWKEGEKAARLKAKADRGRMCEGWVDALSKALSVEFNSMSALAVKSRLITLKTLANQIINNNDSSKYSVNMTNYSTELLLLQELTLAWVQGLARLYQIVSWAHSDKHGMTAVKEKEVEVVRPDALVTILGLPASKCFDENDVESAHETQLVINTGNWKVLGV